MGVSRRRARDERVSQRAHERGDAGADETSMGRRGETVHRGSNASAAVFRLNARASGETRAGDARERRRRDGDGDER